ncbi:MAG: hypothetical protein FJZ90_05190 [Chloroflexi bacterium]|nr:hypothetical protein [Chloroflexota bacterium]
MIHARPGPGAWLPRPLFRQLIVALICFAAPLGLLPLTDFWRARQAGALSHAGRWERVETWPGDSLVRQLIAAPKALPGFESPMLFAVGAAGGLYLSSDDGRTWIRSAVPTSGSRLGSVRIVDLAVHPRDPSELYVALAPPPNHPRPIVYWSRDAGLAWQVRGGLGPRRVEALEFDPPGEELYILTSGDVVRAYVQEGDWKHFVRSESELQDAVVASIGSQVAVTQFVVAQGPADEQAAALEGERAPRDLSGVITLAVGTSGRGLWLFRQYPNPTQEGWAFRLVLLADDPVSLYVRQQAAIRALCYDPEQALLLVGADMGLYQSTDGGQSWSRQGQALRRERVRALLLEPVAEAGKQPGAGRIYAGLAGGGVFSSDDRGATWQPVGEGLGRLSVTSLAMLDRGAAEAEGALNARTLYAGTTQGLWRLGLP